MFKRTLAKTLDQAASGFPVVVLTGPRQSGKTTLLKSLFLDHIYISLESPDTLTRVQEDPRGFFAKKDGKWIIDEAQNYPELFSYIQEFVDTNSVPGQFILSGSQNFLLSEHVSQTLAGRAATLELLPLSFEEYLTHPKTKELGVWEFLFNGSYPRVYQEHLPVKLWYESYIRTYVERDVRTLINVRNLATFQLFLRLCAGRHGQLLNLNSLAQDCGISQTTAAEWLSILEASYLVFRLKPYFRNFNKRVIKTPKLYFYDSGIVCTLLGIESPEHLHMHAARGAIFEGFALSEIIKQYLAQGRSAPIYFWRDQAGTEVDGVIESHKGLQAIEIKSTATFQSNLLDGLKKWQKITSEEKNLFLIYAGEKSFMHQNISVLPWSKIKF